MPHSYAIALAAAISLLVGCNIPGPSLAGYEGLQFKVRTYYNRYATEETGQCRAPEMVPTATEVLEDTPERVVIAVRYRYVDRQFGDSEPAALGGFPNLFSCRGFATRKFTVDKGPEGALTVVDMSGPKRNPKNFAG